MPDSTDNFNTIKFALAIVLLSWFGAIWIVCLIGWHTAQVSSFLRANFLTNPISVAKDILVVLAHPSPPLLLHPYQVYQ